MGYYTHYRLTWTPPAPVSKPCEACNGTGQITLDDSIKEFITKQPYLYNATEPVASALNEEVKWYEHENDMKRISVQFPDTLFTLKGEGEETGDIWVKYFKNGKMQVAKAEIKVPGFNES